MKNGSRLLRSLLKVSEKAANIARACRQNESLFELLIQEKTSHEKNPRFFQDFKTLADVLIQETIRHDIGIEFPELAKMIKGEENNTFSNTLGETITVEVCSTLAETTELLAKVLDNDDKTAHLLSTEVHRDVILTDVPINIVDVPTDFEISIDDLSIWVDPIDNTADYINGNESIDEESGMHLTGLHCVTVLIGAYLQSTGLPVMGVVNQPFYEKRDLLWKGSCYWGLFDNGIKYCSIKTNDDNDDIKENSKCKILLSRFENHEIKAKLIEKGFTPIEAAGAGYKILSVATGQVDAYILSRGSTYRWDTCGPQAILRSLGGGIIDFQNCKENFNSMDLEIIYSNSEIGNKGGLIAYRDSKTLSNLCSALFQ
ncbi:inositol polyphosphate 1-phosphatase [Leptopilina boulardi]|uniref:inositol polyphosphate 1-phosphatase n=1 Tax=Leptopilina boulardi TaxID=63433 RepID=UPI0021F63AA2|nr:inositol polyphosphate 1-phosphatase [Leptopilina boulardi]